LSHLVINDHGSDINHARRVGILRAIG